MLFLNLFNKSSTSFGGRVSHSKRQTTEAKPTRDAQIGLTLVTPETPIHLVYQNALGGVVAHLFYRTKTFGWGI